jgi:putative ABC transport system ATP-binding protein
MAGKTLIVTMRDAALAQSFDYVVTLDGTKITSTSAQAGAVPEPEPVEEPASEQPDVQALRTVPMFAAIDTTRLKLISLASERLSFVKGQILFRQGDPSDAAYIILSGAVEVFAETAAGRRRLGSVEAHSVVGEMGIIGDAPRSATVIAARDLIALSLSRDVFLGLLADFPPVALAVMRDQINRVLSAEARLPPPA